MVGNKRISDLTPILGADIASTDLLAIVDLSADVGSRTKKTTVADLGTALALSGGIFQPLDSTLTALAALAIVANSVTLGTGTDAFSQLALTTNTFLARGSTGNAAAKIITDFGLDLVDSSNASAARTTLGLAIGSDVQAWDAQLDSLASLSYSGNALKVVRVNAGATGFELATVTSGGGGTWGSITGTLSDQTDLQSALDAKQPLDAALTSLAAGSDFVQFTGPTTSTKVFTLPNSSQTLLYSGGPLGTPTSGVATNLTGTAAGLTAGNATLAATVTVVDSTSSNDYVALLGSDTGSLAVKTDGGLRYDATTGTLTASVLATSTNVNVASTGAIDFASGDVVLTHSTNTITLSGGNLALGSNSLTMTGSIGATGARVTKGWFTDLESTNAIVGSITGNAATATLADDSTSTTMYPVFAATATGSVALKTRSTRWTYNPNTSVMFIKGPGSKLQLENTDGGTCFEVLGTDGSTVYFSVDNTNGIIDAGVFRIANGAGLYTKTSSGNTFKFNAYDVDGTSYTTFMTFTAGNTPTCVFTNPVDCGTPSAIVLTNATGTAAGLTAGLATVLATVRTIGGSNFDGSANVTSFPSPGAIGGSTPAAGTFTALTGTSGSITGLTALAVRDTSAAFDVTIAAASSTNLSAGRTLTLDLVNAARTLKLTGNPTIADWFDQSVKAGASPTFVTVTAALSGNATTATTLATSRNLWGQAFDGSAAVTGSLTSVADITGGTSSMTITAGTGASRTLVFKTTTSGSTATTALTLAADQSATFANTVNATTFVGALTGTASGNLVSGGALGTPSSGTMTNCTGLPVAGITSSTSTALGVGSLELGAASDTTLSRSGAGKIAVEGKAIPLMSGSVDVVFAGPTAPRTYTLPDADTTLGAASTGANPVASVGLSAVNGSAGTFLRSDGAPALDVTIAPTWSGVHTFTPTARSSGSAAYLTINAPADTALTASTEAIGVNFAGATRQHATGALATQREYVFGAPTYSFVGASTLSNASTVAITDAPAAGTNATITNRNALLISTTQGDNARGVRVNSSGSNNALCFTAVNTCTGSGGNYGMQVSVTGASADNRGIDISVSGGTNNTGLLLQVNSASNTYAIYSAGTAISLFAADIQITTVGTGSTSVVTSGATQTLTNKTMYASSNVVEEITSTSSSATPTPTGGSLRNFYFLTAQAGTGAFAAPSGSPVNGNLLTIRIKTSGTQTISWDAIYRAINVTLPTSIASGKTCYLGARYNSTDSKWDVFSVVTEA